MNGVIIDDSELKQVVKKLAKIPKEIPKAMAQAINRTVTHTATLTKREVVKIYAVKQKDVSSTLTKKRATAGSLRGYVKSNGNNIELSKFPYNPKVTSRRRKRVKVKVRRDRGYQVINTSPPAFTNTNQVWQRKGKNRFPRKKLYTLSIPSMISNPEIADPIKEKAAKKLEERVRHEIERRLNV